MNPKFKKLMFKEVKIDYEKKMYNGGACGADDGGDGDDSICGTVAAGFTRLALAER